MKQNFKNIASVVLMASTMIVPAYGEDGTATPSNEVIDEGTDLISEGFKLLFEGLAEEIEPMADEMAEGWGRMIDKFSDLQVYYPPETLPNGDIIIRRREPLVPEDSGPGETDL